MISSVKDKNGCYGWSEVITCLRKTSLVSEFLTKGSLVQSITLNINRHDKGGPAMNRLVIEDE